jgi:hypothetical protein
MGGLYTGWWSVPIPALIAVAGKEHEQDDHPNGTSPMNHHAPDFPVSCRRRTPRARYGRRRARNARPVRSPKSAQGVSSLDSSKWGQSKTYGHANAKIRM